MKLFHFLFVALILGAPLTAKNFNLEVLLQKCTSEKKPLLIYFSADSKKNSEVEEILKQVETKFIFQDIDISTLSKEEKKEITERYHLKELPRLVLFDEKGAELSRYGIFGEKSETIVAELFSMVEKSSSLRTAMNHLSEFLAFPLQLEELYKTALELKRIDEASKILSFGVTQDILYFLIEKYRLCSEKGDKVAQSELRQKAIALDPQNEREAFFSLAIIDFQTLASQKSADAIKPLEEYVNKFGEKDHKNLWRLEMMIAQYYLNSDDWNSSLKHAEMAFQEAPLEVKKEIAKCCSYIKGQLSDNTR